MRFKKDTVKGTVLVAIVLSLICSVIVSFAAVQLKPIQDKNKRLDRKSNILMAAGLYEEGIDIEKVFAERVEAHVLDLETGQYVPEANPEAFDERRAAKNPQMSQEIAPAMDVAGIRRRSNRVVVYEVKQDDQLDQVVVPIQGKGLWSTLYGFMAIDADGNTVRGIGFYEHGETPGLGGEIDNPKWKGLWKGKKIHDEQGRIRLEVVKGSVDPRRESAQYQVDGLSGATITSRGVSNLVQYWLGEQGYKTYLQQLQDMQEKGEARG